MNEFIWFLLTVAAGAAGGMLAIRMKVPVGGIIGAMLAVILLNVVSGGQAVFYPSVKLAVQLTVGTMCGSKIGKEDFVKLRTILLPVLIIFPLMIVYNLIFGTAIYRAGNLDVYTSFYSLSPGSVSDIAIIAEELGADGAIVGLIHAIRVLVCSSLIPGLFGMIMKKRGMKPDTEAAGEKSVQEDRRGAHMPKRSGNTRPNAGFRMAALFGGSIASGLFFRYLGINGGAIIGSMMFSACFSCIFGKSSLPGWLKRIQQMSTGTYIGTGITLATLLGARNLVIPIILLVLDILISTFLTSYLVLKTGKMDFVSTMASCNPGGLTEMLLVTDEMGGDVSRVAVVHSFRLFFVITVFPLVINWFVQFL